MPTRSARNSTPSGAVNPAITPNEALPPELLRRLSELGIAPDSIPEPDGEFVGISHAAGPQETQAELDSWIEAGGMPDFEDDDR